jgi:chorismate dehydratase
MKSEKIFQIVKTEDGSSTLFHPEFGETFHSTTAGALRESEEKFLKPSRVLEKFSKTGRVSILEVGFGLGYNATVTVFNLLKTNPEGEIFYLSFEEDLSPLKEASLVGTPFEGLHRRIKTQVLERGFFKEKNVTVKVLVGEARKLVKGLSEEKFDAIYHDPFSPKKNCELWSLEFLRELLKRLNTFGFWVTYSSSLSVRKALYLLGVKIFSTKPVGRRRPGTAATILNFPDGVYTNLLTQREKEKLFLSPYAVPFRDPKLNLPREEICRRWREEIEKNLKSSP